MKLVFRGRYLIPELPDHAVPLAVGVDVAVLAVGHDVELVLELELLGQGLDQVDAVALVLLLERHPLLGLFRLRQDLCDDEGGVLSWEK